MGIPKRKNTSELLNEVLKTDASMICDTLSEINQNAFGVAVDALIKGRHIYILGVRNSAPLAQMLSFYLNPILPCVRLIHTNSASEIYEQMIHIGPKDVVIGISFPRYSMRVLKALEFANSRRARVITITDSEHSPINMYSSCSLLAKSQLCSIMDSLTPAMSVINALVLAVSEKKKKKVMQKLEELEQVWDDYPVDNHDEMNPLADEFTIHHIE